MELRQRKSKINPIKPADDVRKNSEIKKNNYCFLCGLVCGMLLCLRIFLSESLIEPVSISYPNEPQMAPELELNKRLSKASRQLEGRFSGPECVIAVNATLYTGILNGTVLKIIDQKIELFSRFGPVGCNSMATCGRPLGMRHDAKRNQLLVADAYLGVFSIDLDTGHSSKIFPRPEDSVKVTFFNDLVLLPDGKIVLSESSQKFPLADLIWDLFEGVPTGRLLLIDPVTGKWSVLAEGLYFANGVALHSDGATVLVAETGMPRVMRVPLVGGVPTVFTDQLPGFPDNINRSPRGGYWISMAGTHLKDSPNLLVRLGGWPRLRKLIHKIFPAYLLQYLATLNKHALIARIDEDGRLIETLHDVSGNIYNVADVHEEDGILWLGSYRANFIGKLVL